MFPTGAYAQVHISDMWRPRWTMDSAWRLICRLHVNPSPPLQDQNRHLQQRNYELEVQNGHLQRTIMLLQEQLGVLQESQVAWQGVLKAAQVQVQVGGSACGVQAGASVAQGQKGWGHP